MLPTTHTSRSHRQQHCHAPTALRKATTAWLAMSVRSNPYSSEGRPTSRGVSWPVIPADARAEARNTVLLLQRPHTAPPLPRCRRGFGSLSLRRTALLPTASVETRATRVGCATVSVLLRANSRVIFAHPLAIAAPDRTARSPSTHKTSAARILGNADRADSPQYGTEPR